MRQNKIVLVYLLSSLLVAAIVLGLIIYYNQAHHLADSALSIRIFGTEYVGASNKCITPKNASAYGFVKLCTEVIRAKAINYSMPEYLIITSYSFGNRPDAAAFVGSLGNNLNTTPWPGQKINTTTSENTTYTTIFFPNYNNTGKTAIVLAEYLQLGSTVLSVSTSNFTGAGNLSNFRKSVDSAMFYLAAHPQG